MCCSTLLIFVEKSMLICSDELSALTNEVVSGVESITKTLSKLGEYTLNHRMQCNMV